MTTMLHDDAAQHYSHKRMAMASLDDWSCLLEDDFELVHGPTCLTLTLTASSALTATSSMRARAPPSCVGLHSMRSFM